MPLTSCVRIGGRHERAADERELVARGRDACAHLRRAHAALGNARNVRWQQSAPAPPGGRAPPCSVTRSRQFTPTSNSTSRPVLRASAVASRPANARARCPARRMLRAARTASAQRLLDERFELRARQHAQDDEHAARTAQRALRSPGTDRRGNPCAWRARCNGAQRARGGLQMRPSSHRSGSAR